MLVALIATNVEYGLGTVKEIVIRLMTWVHWLDVAWKQSGLAFSGLTFCCRLSSLPSHGQLSAMAFLVDVNVDLVEAVGHFVSVEGQ
jgi:hypothetical protein